MLKSFFNAFASISSGSGFSALQRAEIAEIRTRKKRRNRGFWCFSALQRAEIAEIQRVAQHLAALRAEVSVLFNVPKLLKFKRASICRSSYNVSVLFNEPKLLKSPYAPRSSSSTRCFSALQRAEIAEIFESALFKFQAVAFQCSSTSRNC